MVDICISIAGKVAEYTVAPVLRQFGYLVHFGSNVRSLNSQVEKLDARRTDLERRVEAAKDSLQIIKSEVENWLSDAEKTIQEKKARFEDASIAKATCCSNGWFPNLKVRYSLSRKAKKMTLDVDKLFQNGDFDSISCGARRQKIQYQRMQYYEDSTEAPAKQPHEGAIASSSSGASNPTNPPAHMDLSERLKYRLPYTKDLLKALQDDKINMIGISGIIREIDTVTTKEFIKRMKHRNFFEEVVMAVVSQQDPDLKRIQGEIADMLDLKLENGSLVERAQRLRAAMSAILDSKRLLLILADVRQVLDLASIGISSGDGNKRCKIILISQLENVFGEMTTQTNFELLLQSTPGDRAVEFESRISVIRDVMDALTDDESNPIVLCDLPSFIGISNSNYKGMARLPVVSSLYKNSLTVEYALFFDPKVYFPVLRELHLKGLGNWKEIWNSQCSPNSFCELTNLDVRDCDKLWHLVPTHMQNRLQKLKTILVWDCSSLEEIFEVRRLNANEGDASSISQSKKIPSSISQPDQGMQINNIMDFKQSRPGFQNLTELWVSDCHSLRYLLSPSIARGLVRLESLRIWRCEKIEEIVAAAEGEEKEVESILPRLKYLKLWDVLNLGSFSLGKYTFDWPLLQVIDITECNKMNDFCTGSLSIPRKVYITVCDCGENLEQELNNCRKEI
ncbi:hypothetical protein M0R45_010058 [Rubus argutus]|uniref:Uncharacterized protein n=1 Tax=Rubus argutus TaxID=59490 RepID=A0AAW1Y6B4_RUBAR